MKHSLTICWLYPDLMSTYGDRGNVIVLEKRCQWRDISIRVIRHTIGSSVSDIDKADIVFMGGGEDRQQGLVSVDMKGKKARAIQKKIQEGTPGLFICGAFQFLGKYYKAADGHKIPGLSLFDLYTEHPGDQKTRLIGNIVSRWEGIDIVGFENHGGRTYLGNGTQPFGRVHKGHGNNDSDDTEGVLINHAIGTYLHGPLLPKNPEVADWLISKALSVKYGKEISLSPLDDSLSQKARADMIKRIT